MVRINGNDVAAAGQNLQAFLEKEGYRCDRIAIELNGTIVPRRTLCRRNPPRWRFYGNRPFRRWRLIRTTYGFFILFYDVKECFPWQMMTNSYLAVMNLHPALS